MQAVLDPVLLARIQFAFTVSFHIIFPAFTIGLASWLAVVEWRWLKTRDVVYKDIYQMWVKIFAVCFGMGVVSGVVMSYQFGTNWSFFSDKVGNVIGPLIGYEVLTAFFLEASFLGIMLFGWGRVSERMHFIATCIVAAGTLFSAFWILSANSWMQTPAGYKIGAGGVFVPTSWMQIIFNPSFFYRFLHMVAAAYLNTAFVVGGISAFYLFRKKYVHHAKIMFGMAMLMAVFVAPIQLLIGHIEGLETLKHQPVKIAAMEANWNRGAHKPMILFAVPDEKAEKNKYEVDIPGGASWVLTGNPDGVIPGLTEVPAKDRPPVMIPFYGFRIMVGVGVLMALTGIFAFILFFRKKLFNTRWFQAWCILMTPIGFLGILSGWFISEVGRQPWTAYGLLRTVDSVSPLVAQQVLGTLIAFVLVYSFVFGAGLFYIFKLIRKGPPVKDEKEQYYDNSMEASVTKHFFDGGKA